MSIQLGVNPDHSCEHIPKSDHPFQKKQFEREIFRRYEYQYIVSWKILPIPPSYSTGPTFCCSDLGHFGRVANGPMGLESWRYLRFMYSDSWGQCIPIVTVDMPSIIWELIPSKVWEVGSWLMQLHYQTLDLQMATTLFGSDVVVWGKIFALRSTWTSKNKGQLRQMSPQVFDQWEPT